MLASYRIHLLAKVLGHYSSNCYSYSCSNWWNPHRILSLSVVKQDGRPPAAAPSPQLNLISHYALSFLGAAWRRRRQQKWPVHLKKESWKPPIQGARESSCRKSRRKRRRAQMQLLLLWLQTRRQAVLLLLASLAQHPENANGRLMCYLRFIQR